MSTPKPRRAPDRFEHRLRAAMLDALTSEVADAVLFNALRSSARDDIPSDPAGFVMFVHGALDLALERRVGREEADQVLSSIQPLLVIAHAELRKPVGTSGIAPKSQPQMPRYAFESEELFPEVHESGVHERPPISDAPSVSTPSRALSFSPCGAPEDAATILVASGDMMLRNALRKALEEVGHRVLVAIDGHVALALCARYQPTLVISALDMPRVDGHLLKSSLKLAFGQDAPPIVALVDDDEAVLSGFAGQLRWPAQPSDLLLVVADALADKR